MTYETLETEVKAIIEDAQEQIKAEESGAKSANFQQLKKRLAAAEKLQSDVAEGKKYGMGADFFKFDLSQLKDPIY